MVSFYPIDEEVRLLRLDKDKLEKIFKQRIDPIENRVSKEEKGGYLFTGVWNEHSFSISVKLKISNNFVPVINGSMLESDEGILIKMQFSLFPATKKLLMFWTVLTILITLFFVGIYQAWLYGAISMGFCLVNYVLARENFKMQVRKSKRLLDKMFSSQESD